MRGRVTKIILIGAMSLAALATHPQTCAAPLPDGRYAYGSAAFQSLVQDSYRESRGSGQGPSDFKAWLETSYWGCRVRLVEGQDGPLEAVLDRERAILEALAAPGPRAREELRFLDGEFRVIKRILPRFTLDRGFEFRYAAEKGERQCLLQSVLIAALAQRAGLDAGIAMVYRNQAGQVSNLGHVVTMARLADGNHVLVDASDPEPFMRHQGLMLRHGAGYRFVRPEYAGDSARIVAYRWEDGGRREVPGNFQPLDLPYVRSQFYYYRGERQPGALVLGPRSAQGLAGSARLLEECVRLSPANPLATYMLGRVRQEQGQAQQARVLLVRARDEYLRYGWLPPGPRDALARLTSPGK